MNTLSLVVSRLFVAAMFLSGMAATFVITQGPQNEMLAIIFLYFMLFCEAGFVVFEQQYLKFRNVLKEMR